MKIMTKKGIRELHIIENSKLDCRLKLAIVPHIFSICSEGFEIPEDKRKDPDFVADVEWHVLKEPFIGLVMEKDKIALYPGDFDTYQKESSNHLIAFVSYRLVEIATGETVVYFSALMVAEEYRGQGIASGIMDAIMRRHETNLMALRTQNPVMRQSVQGVCELTHPSLDKEQRPPAEFITIGAIIAQELGMEKYDPLKMIEAGTYGKLLYGGEELPRLAEALTPNALSLNDAFWKLINPRDGGSMIVVGMKEVKK